MDPNTLVAPMMNFGQNAFLVVSFVVVMSSIVAAAWAICRMYARYIAPSTGALATTAQHLDSLGRTLTTSITEQRAHQLGELHVVLEKIGSSSARLEGMALALHGVVKDDERLTETLRRHAHTMTNAVPLIKELLSIRDEVERAKAETASSSQHGAAA